MSMLSIVIQKNLTIEEAGELTHLEDEVTQAQDELEFARELETKIRDWSAFIEAKQDTVLCRTVLIRARERLSNYQACVAKNVLARIPSYQ